MRGANEMPLMDHLKTTDMEKDTAHLEPAKEKAEEPLSLTTCSPLGVAVRGYLENRLSLVQSLGKVSFVYGDNGHAKAKEITQEIARIDVIVAGLVSPENDPAQTPPESGTKNHG